MAERFKACSVDGCNKDASHSRAGRLGFCCAHYQRFKKYGDPNILVQKTGDGEPQDFFRNVVVPYDGDECLIWPFSKTADGYAKMIWNGRGATVTRILCEMSTGSPGEGLHAAHSCGNGMKGCVTKGHVSWKTEAENQAEKFIHGTVLRGENNPPAKLTNDQVVEIVSLRGTLSHSKLGKRFGVGTSTIGQIMNGARWSWLTGIEPSSGRRHR